MEIKTNDYDSGNGTKIELCGENIKITTKVDSGFVVGRMILPFEELVQKLDIPIELLEDAAQTKLNSVQVVKDVLSSADDAVQWLLSKESDSMPPVFESLIAAVLLMRGSNDPDLE